MAFIPRSELESMGFKELGDNVLISDRASIYNPKKIEIGSNVRIDDFCVISAGDGGISFGDYVHVAVYSLLMGAGRITMSSFSGLSSRVSIYSSNDDYSGASLTNPTVPVIYRNVVSKDVFLGKHVIVGTGSTILPGVNLGYGSAVGAHTLVSKDCEALTIYSGVPAKPIKKRKNRFEELESQLRS